MKNIYNKIEMPISYLNKVFPRRTKNKTFQEIDNVIFYVRNEDSHRVNHINKNNISRYNSSLMQFSYFVIGFKNTNHYVKRYYPYMFDHFQHNNGVVDEIYQWAMDNHMNINQQSIIQFKNRVGLSHANYIVRFSNKEDYIACKLRWG